MLKKFLDLFLEKKIKDIVCTEDILNSLNNQDKEYIKTNFDVQNFNDLRSATFFSNGEVNSNNKPVILLVKGEFLPNIYTGITEAWFQRSNINIISIFEKYDDMKVEYLERCIPDILTIYDNSIEEYKNTICKFINKNMPSMINIKYALRLEEKADYTNIINMFDNIVKNKVDVFIYNSKNESKNNINIINIEPKYKYGILSKYMGYITAKEKKSLLILPYELLKIDLNIFNNRYINGNVKIIINKEKKQSNIEEWIKDNNIEILKTKNLDKSILGKFWNTNKASTLIIEEERQCIQM